jgi:hypothetical protein
MDAPAVDAAVEDLRDREGVFKTNVAKDIGRWTTGSPSPITISGLAEWATSRGIEAVVWTALERKFHDDGSRASADDVAAYLSALTGRTREDAERYVRRAPPQIDTPFRRAIEAKLGWTPATPKK